MKTCHNGIQHTNCKKDVYNLKPEYEQLCIMPIRVRVASVIRKTILAGEYPAGHPLSLTTIAKQMGVSRTPVREAFQMLEHEGLLSLRMNKSAIVKPIDSNFIIDHFYMRSLLEGEAARRACEMKMDVSKLETLQNRINSIKNHISPNEYYEYNQDVHMSIWEASRSSKLKSFLSDLWNGPSIGKSISENEHMLKSIQEHGDVIKHIKENQPELAKIFMENHITRSLENILKSYDEEVSKT